MAPEAAAEAMAAPGQRRPTASTRERRASGEADRQELAAVKKKMKAMIDVIEDGGYVRGMVDRLRELEARQDELEAKLGRGACRRSRRSPERRRHLPPEGRASGSGAEQPRRARRGRAGNPGADRADRAHARYPLGERPTRSWSATSAPSSNGRVPRTGGARRALKCRRCRSRWLRG